MEGTGTSESIQNNPWKASSRSFENLSKEALESFQQRSCTLIKKLSVEALGSFLGNPQKAARRSRKKCHSHQLARTGPRRPAYYNATGNFFTIISILRKFHWYLIPLDVTFAFFEDFLRHIFYNCLTIGICSAIL